jgi:hypothetical protein
MVPEGTLPGDRIPIIDPVTGKVSGYEATPPGPERQLSGGQEAQTSFEFPGQQELFEGPAPIQPEQTLPEPLPTPEPVLPLPEMIQEVVSAAKQDPTASKILKGNNAATAKIVSERIQGLMSEPDADPVEAMERLYEMDKTGTYPAGTKALTEAQNELLQAAYRKTTGRDIEEAIKERAFMGAEQADLFEGEAPPPAPPVEPAVARNPADAWNEHKNDDHPAFDELTPEEQATWSEKVAAGRGNAVNFQDVVAAREERINRETKRTPEQIERALTAYGAEMLKDVEAQLKGKDFKQVLVFLTKNGPEANREIARAMLTRMEEMRRAGFTFKFSIASTPEDVRRIGGYSSSGVGGRVRPNYAGRLMDVSVAGKNSGQYGNGASLEVTTHESLHAITAAVIEYGQYNRGVEAHKVYKELVALHKHVIQHLEAKKAADPNSLNEFERSALAGYNNALGNKGAGKARYNEAHEMISWGMSNSDMMLMLESIPYKNTNVFESFVKAVRQLLGLAPKADTALSQVISLSRRAIAAPITELYNQKPVNSRIIAQETGAPLGPAVVPAPGQPYTLPKATKLEPAKTAGEKVVNTAKKISDSWNNDSFWTKFRIAAVDPGAGLSKTLSSLPIFQNGQLRADMLIRSFSQVINLIRNGLQTGIPVINSDGTIIIERSDNNLSQSEKLADALDNNPIVKGSGLSGRGYIAEIARIKRGQEVMAEDKAVRDEAKKKMQSAKDKMARAKMLRAAGAPLTDILKLVNEAKAIRAKWRDAVELNREKQITAAHIQWADEQLQAVPESKPIFDIWRNINMALIDLNEATGNFSKEKADKYRSKRYYVPLFASRVDMGPEKQETYTGSRTGTKSVAKEYHLEGSDLQRNIWENMDKYYAAATASAFQNQTRRVAVKQLMSAGIDAAKFARADDPRVNLRYRDPSSEYADNNGVVSVILDNPNDLAAFQMLHYELGPIMKGLSATTQVLRAGALINPMYWIRQLVRDPVHASLVANAGVVTPFHSLKEYINVLANNSEEAKILATRGVIGQIDSTVDLYQFLDRVGSERMDPSTLQKMFHKVMQMHEASDAATRVAIYKQVYAKAIKDGLSKEDATNLAVYKAREAINFSVRGNSKTLNALRHSIPFFSAALTSLDTVYRAATGYGLNPEEKKAAQSLFAKRAAMMSVLSVAYALLLQDDEDYKKLPDYVKDNNWLLPSPAGDGRSFIKVAVPFELGFLFKTLPEASVRYMAGTSTGKEVLASVLAGIQHNLPGGLIPIPQALKPGLEAVTNYSFHQQRSIEGKADQALPVAARGPNASEFAKMLSSFGLDKIGLSPVKIDYLVQGYTAELGATSINIASGLINAATGKEPPDKNLEQQPFFKAFLTNPNTSKAASDYYDLAQNAQEAVNYVNRLKKEGRIEEAKEYLSDEKRQKLISAAPAYRRIGEQMSKVRAEINRVKNDVNRTPQAKLEEINRLQMVYDRVARQGYKVAETAGISR